MTREEALDRFTAEQGAILGQFESQFWSRMQEEADRIEEIMKSAFLALRTEAERQKKDNIAFIYFSLLRTDLFERRFRVMAEAVDARWLMDEEPACTVLSLDFLYEPLNALWDFILEESRKYVGKVNSYDVFALIQHTVLKCHSMIAQLLRMILRGVENDENFAALPKGEAWSIHWGEYRGESEAVAAVDRSVKSRKDWERARRKLNKNANAMNGSYWFGAKLKEKDCRDTQLCFTTFENCSFEQVDFEGSNMAGSRFIRCRLKECSFIGCSLNQSEFSGCTWEGADFEGADLTRAVFGGEDLLCLSLDPEQLSTILVDEGVKNEIF